MKQEDKIIFDLEQVGYRDLEGEFIKIPFDKKDLGNALFTHANSIEMDEFAKQIHKEGKGELTEEVENELMQVLPPLYPRRRVIEAVKEYINTLKTK